MQLAIWYTVDNKPNESLAGFSMLRAIQRSPRTTTSLISFAGYDPSTNYAANFWQATHDPSNTLYQDLVSAGSVPEPSTWSLSMISGLFLVGLRFWRLIG